MVFLIPLGCILFGVSAGCSRGVAAKDARDADHPVVRRAVARAAQGDVDGAVGLYRQALDDDGTLARAHFDLALLLHEKCTTGDRTNNLVGAVHHYQRYLELRPETEKRELIEGRISSALQSLNSLTGGKDARKLERLRQDNVALQKDVQRLEQEVARLKASGPDRRVIPSVTAGPASARSLAGSGRDGVAPKAVRTYTVKPGDSLGAIAAQVYGDTEKWDLVYRANRGILKSPDTLSPGQVLVLP